MDQHRDPPVLWKPAVLVGKINPTTDMEDTCTSHGHRGSTVYVGEIVRKQNILFEHTPVNAKRYAN